MKKQSMYFLSVLAIAGCANSRKNDFEKTNRGASLKSITVNDPELKKNMNGPASEAEKDALLKNLKYQVSIKSQNCDQGVTAEDKALAEQPISQPLADSIFKVKTGCDYIVSIVYIDRTNASEAKEVLKSDGTTVNLSKEELKKSKPIAQVLLLSTPAGAHYWLTDKPIETPKESDIGISPRFGTPGTSGESKYVASPCLSTEPESIEKGINCIKEFGASSLTQTKKYEDLKERKEYMSIFATKIPKLPLNNSEVALTNFCSDLVDLDFDLTLLGLLFVSEYSEPTPSTIRESELAKILFPAFQTYYFPYTQKLFKMPICK